MDDLSFWDEKRKIAYKKFNKYFKKARRSLIKKAKQFKCFDYFYMEDVLFDMLQIMYQYYKNPDLLVQDTEHGMSNWKNGVKALERINEIIEILRQEHIDLDSCLATMEKEYELKQELYKLVSDNFTNWWD